MGSYEREKGAQKLWEECMSDDESNISEFGDVYLSDEYKPKSDEETSSDNDILVERAKRRKNFNQRLGRQCSRSMYCRAQYKRGCGSHGNHKDIFI
ncbi:unnamed protein product [Acanthoscelides obtectus]|uniref:Uncharacterized protein n=1 Tax=Acanthoscelides obtectus TaxID=200917 RepID=A0A9P0KPH3_ACAOB|nr:unnamed protein product [Acanthoscelides obtectus]CAK1646430.1 hypothetical protein AOBTE_LOCUS14628 [Acanthoscelides obtectus]